MNSFKAILTLYIMVNFLLIVITYPLHLVLSLTMLYFPFSIPLLTGAIFGVFFVVHQTGYGKIQVCDPEDIRRTQATQTA